MNASDVMSALRLRWPDNEHIIIPEAPQDAKRQGRKIDLLVISMWQSRGFERDAVEIKVSMSDFRREIKQPAKADWWWSHVHRFWVAMPEDLALKAKDELPPGWGLLSVRTQGDRHVSVIKVKPTRNDAAEDLPAQAVLGILRAAENAGPSALERARSAGYMEGLEHAKKTMQPQPVAPAPPNDAVRKLQALAERHGMETVVDAVRALSMWGHRPIDIARQMESAASQVRSVAQAIDQVREATLTALAPNDEAAA